MIIMMMMIIMIQVEDDSNNDDDENDSNNNNDDDDAGRGILQARPRGELRAGWGGGEAQPQHEGPDQPHEGEVPAAQETLHQDAQWQQQQHPQGAECLIMYGGCRDGGDVTVTSLIAIMNVRLNVHKSPPTTVTNVCKKSLSDRLKRQEIIYKDV